MDTESEGVRKTSGGQMAYQEVLKFSREEVRAVINNSDTFGCLEQSTRKTVRVKDQVV